VFSVCGAVDEDEALGLAERWFGAEHGPPVGEPEPAAFVGGPAGETRRL